MLSRLDLDSGRWPFPFDVRQPTRLLRRQIEEKERKLMEEAEKEHMSVILNDRHQSN